MAGLNKCTFIGHVGKDPEPTKGNGSGMTFSLAVNRVWKNKDGEKQEDTQWVNCVVWPRGANNSGLVGVVQQYVTRGKQVYIEARFQERSWDDVDSGKKMYRSEFTVDELILLGGRGDDTRELAGAGSSSSSSSNMDMPF